MATYLDEGLEEVPKLINGVSTSPFTDLVLGSGTTAESTSQTLADATVITTGGLGRATATCGAESPNKATWGHDFTSTQDGMQVNEVLIVNANDKSLMRHKYSSTKAVDNTEVLTVSVVYTESRAS